MSSPVLIIDSKHTTWMWVCWAVGSRPLKIHVQPLVHQFVFDVSCSADRQKISDPSSHKLFTLHTQSTSAINLFLSSSPSLAMSYSSAVKKVREHLTVLVCVCWPTYMQSRLQQSKTGAQESHLIQRRKQSSVSANCSHCPSTKWCSHLYTWNTNKVEQLWVPHQKHGDMEVAVEREVWASLLPLRPKLG